MNNSGSTIDNGTGVRDEVIDDTTTKADPTWMIIGILLGSLVIVVVCGCFCMQRVNDGRRKMAQKDADNVDISEEGTPTLTSPINSKPKIQSGIVNGNSDDMKYNEDIDHESRTVSKDDEKVELVPSAQSP